MPYYSACGQLRLVGTQSQDVAICLECGEDLEGARIKHCIFDREFVLLQKLLKQYRMAFRGGRYSAGQHHAANEHRRTLAYETPGFLQAQGRLTVPAKNGRCSRLKIRRAIDQGAVEIKDDVHQPIHRYMK